MEKREPITGNGEVDDVLLSSSVSVKSYRELEEAQKREGIADFILERFRERYITPLRGDPQRKNGFCTMAVSCLLIEALESFWRGLPDTKRQGESRKVLQTFFKRCKDQGGKLGVFANHADFYEGVRCVILHQAEITCGWHISRKGPLYDPATKTINATEFHAELKKCIERYGSKLRASSWGDKVWKNLKKKMASVIDNCQRRK